MAAPKFLKGGPGQMQPMSRALRPGTTDEASAPKSKPLNLGKFGGSKAAADAKIGKLPKLPKIPKGL